MEVTWKIEVLSDVPSNRLGVNGQVAKVTWRIENFSSMKDGKYCSEIFTVDGNNWQLWIYPKGDTVGFLSIYLHFAGSANLASKWTRHAHFRIAVIDRLDRKNSKTRGFGSRRSRCQICYLCPPFFLEPVISLFTQVFGLAFGRHCVKVRGKKDYMGLPFIVISY
ncbi:hypothetical protein PVK06_036252 [Gossypium arboreum]|uniref:MATH domain-containing protein n=1 Tax=Gossypium arboreum TaxID=29729 RepID=A0ABR0NJ19_GOSAR|nr:hypothetical protein PVK06_036252 [Gossypium arboreum]